MGEHQKFLDYTNLRRCAGFFCPDFVAASQSSLFIFIAAERHVTDKKTAEKSPGYKRL